MSKKVLTPFNQWEKENKRMMDYKLATYDEDRELLFYNGFDAVSAPVPPKREIIQQMPIQPEDRPTESYYTRLETQKMEALYPERGTEMIDRGGFVVPEFMIGTSTRVEKKPIKRNR